MQMNELDKDTREFIELCLSKKVEFALDLFIRVSEKNASRLEEVLKDFGFAGVGITRSDFLQPRQVVQLGRPPHRIDLRTATDGVSWDEVWNAKTELVLSGLKCWAIGIDQLILNKKASGRAQDVADVARLENARKKRP